jgi:hypothetical protein
MEAEEAPDSTAPVGSGDHAGSRDRARTGAAVWTMLLWRYGGASPGVELDAIRTASTITVAAGGAAEQRITELYTRAVDQLGTKDAPIRLGGLHALERLAEDNTAQRQTIVDVICANLRMPYTPPDDQAPGEDTPEDVHHHHEQRRQELQVRLTAQRILISHLKPEAVAVFWARIDLNLTEAHLPRAQGTVRRGNVHRKRLIIGDQRPGVEPPGCGVHRVR